MLLNSLFLSDVAYILENTTENLLVFLAQAFEEIGGVPKELVIDNLKQFVEKARNKKGMMLF